MLYLIENPNFDSPNNKFGSPRNGELPEVLAKRVLAGLPIGRQHLDGGFRIPPNSAWCEWAAERGFRPEDEEFVNDDASINAKLLALSSLPVVPCSIDDLPKMGVREFTYCVIFYGFFNTSVIKFIFPRNFYPSLVT